MFSMKPIVADEKALDDTPEVDLFENLAFCWKHFEGDGLTGTNVGRYLEYIKGSVLIVGSGQGIVAAALQERGMAPTCIDCSESMARLAFKRFGIKTEIVSFFDFLHRGDGFDSIIVNTGVVYANFLRKHQEQFVKKLSLSLKKDGQVLLTFFRVRDFDSAAKLLKLDQKSEFLIEIWSNLCQGKSLIELLTEKYEHLPEIGYIVLRHREEIEEFEYQVKSACEAYIEREKIGFSDPDLHEFIVNTLPYVSYGISYEEQLSLFSDLAREHFTIKMIDSSDKLVAAILSK